MMMLMMMMMTTSDAFLLHRVHCVERALTPFIVAVVTVVTCFGRIITFSLLPWVGSLKNFHEFGKAASYYFTESNA